MVAAITYHFSEQLWAIGIRALYVHELTYIPPTPWNIQYTKPSGRATRKIKLINALAITACSFIFCGILC